MTFDWETFTYNLDWLHTAVQLEATHDDIQIGGTVPATPPTIAPEQLQAQLQQVRLQSLLFTELRLLLEAANLGAGMDAALTEGRQRIRATLPHLTPDQHQYFEALLNEDATPTGNKPLRGQLRQALCSLLSQDDWQHIAQAAMQTLQAHLLKQVELPYSA